MTWADDQREPAVWRRVPHTPPPPFPGWRTLAGQRLPSMAVGMKLDDELEPRNPRP